MKKKFNKICTQCIRECKQPEGAVLMSCPDYKRIETVIWPCHHCRADNVIEYATSKQIIKCSNCGAKHMVVGHHIDGKPITRLFAPKRRVTCPL